MNQVDIVSCDCMKVAVDKGDMYSLDIYENGLICLNSCCGNCYAMKGFTHCPYCGKKVKVKLK